MKSNTKLFLSSVAASLIIIGCGGGSSSSSTTTSTSTGTVSGTVVDGAIVNADVCLDLNFNKSCDIGEPTAKTDENGRYSIKYTLSEEAKYAPLLAVPTTDSYDKATGKLFVVKLSSPRAGDDYVIASPITTLAAEKVYELKQNNQPVDETSVKAIISTVTEVIKNDTNVSVDDITKIDPSTQPELLATSVTLNKVLEENGELTDVANALDDENSSLSQALPEAYQDLYVEIVDALKSSEIDDPSLLQQVVESAIDQNSTENLGDIVTESNTTKVYEYVITGYLDSVYNDLNSTGLLYVEGVYDIRDWNSTNVAKQVVEDYNITSVNDLIEKTSNNEVQINISDATEFSLNDVISYDNKVLKTKTILNMVDYNVSELNMTDLNGTAVYDLTSGKIYYFNDNNSYKLDDNNGTWEVINNVLNLDGSLYGVVNSRDKGVFDVSLIDENGNIQKTTWVVTPFEEDASYREDEITQILQDVLPAMNIDSRAFNYVTLNIDNTDYFLKNNMWVYVNGEPVGEWNYFENVLSIRLYNDDKTYYCVFNKFDTDNVGFYLIEYKDEKVGYIKYVQQSMNFDFEPFVELMKDQNISIADISASDFENRTFIVNDTLYRFNADGTFVLNSEDDNGSGTWSVVAKEIDGKTYQFLSLIEQINDRPIEIQYYAFETLNDYYYKGHFFITYPTNIGYDNFIPTTLSSLEVNMSDVDEYFNIDTSLFDTDVAGKVFRVADNGRNTYYYFDADGNAIVYYVDRSAEVEPWSVENDILNINGLYILPFSKEGDTLSSYELYLSEEGTLDRLDTVEVQETAFPLEEYRMDMFGFKWYESIAKYAGDMRYNYSNVFIGITNDYIDMSNGYSDGNLTRTEIGADLNYSNYTSVYLNGMRGVNSMSQPGFYVTSQGLKDDDGNDVSLAFLMSVSDSEVTFFVADYNGTDISNIETLGTCDYNLSAYDSSVRFDIATNNSSLVVYNVYDAEDNKICSYTYDVNDSDYSGIFGFNHMVVGIYTNDENGDIRTYTGAYVRNVESVNVNAETFAQHLEFTPVAITNDTFSGKAIAVDLEDSQNNFLLMHSDGTFYDTDDDQNGTWDVQNNVLVLEKNGITTYVAVQNMNGSVINVYGFDIVDGDFNDTVLLLNGNEDTTVENVDDFTALFDNEPLNIDVNSTSWNNVKSDENITFNDDGTFVDQWTEDGNDLNITGEWSIEDNGVIVVDVSSAPDTSLDTLLIMYIGDDNESKIFVGVGLDGDGDVNNAFLKEMTEE